MKNNETSEMLLIQACNSAKLKKLAILFVLAGIIICVMLLLPPLQNAMFSFIDAHITHRGAGGAFESRLRSLLSLPFFGLMIFVLALCCLFSKTISAFLEDAKNTRLITVFAAGTGALFLGFIGIFAYRRGAQWLNSDHASEMVLG
ncbi:MAG: hypothetical protein LBH43_12120, partial [Treponema sp.]|nr:hypothetical protein [Treponema sp.]